MKLSIVTTMYQSARFIEEFYARATRAASAMTDDYEIVFVNDGSPDESLSLAVALYQRDARVRVIDLSRNFGHHKAMMTGLEKTRGDLVFLIDVDLEEQPEWLGEFREVMTRTGADVVYGVQHRRKGNAFVRLSGAIYYRLFNALLQYPVPANVVTARLMTRRYVDSLVQHRDREMTLAPLWVITGYHQTPVTVEKRSRGETSYSVPRRIATFVDMVTSFSNRPLIYIFYLGTAIMALSAVYGAFLVWKTARGEVGVSGWPTVIASIWFLGGTTIFCLGVIGVYLSKIFTESKDRPYTIIREEHDHAAAPGAARECR
jgi:putative glycosyltransferase